MNVQTALLEFLKGAPRGVTIDNIAKKISTNPDLKQAVQEVASELAQLIADNQVGVLLTTQGQIRYMLCERLPRRDKLPLGSAILQIYRHPSGELDLTKIVYEIISQTKTKGITGYTLWETVRVFFSQSSQDPRALHGLLRALTRKESVASTKEAHDRTRYFTKANAPTPKPPTRQAELTTIPTGVWDRQTYTNIKALDIPEWSLHREFEPPATVKVCFGCPTVDQGLLVSGEATIKLTTVSGRQFVIHEPASVTVSIEA